MKYIKITLFFLIFLQIMAFGQDELIILKEKNYNEYLPQAGDISIGADALPYLEYLGNMFNNTVNNSLNLGENTLYFKYFLTDKSAVRAIIGIDNSTKNIRKYVADDFLRLDPLNPNALAEDMHSAKNRDISLNVGYQIYKTHKRLAGYYGAQLGYGFSMSSSEYTYANPITAMNQLPTSYNFNGNVNGFNRTLESTTGNSHAISTGLFIGVEYFFIPKMSIGGEYGLGFQHRWSGQANATSEAWDGSRVIKSDTPYNPSQSASYFSTSRPASYGGLFLSFYF
jgi:hypothetical protein